MNDELTGQLASPNWRIPDYAHDSLWLQTEYETFQTAGAAGLFELTVPAPEITLRWAGEQGPVLNRFYWQGDNLEWDGSIRAGGFIDAVHITQIDRAEMSVAVLFVEGQPLKPHFTPYVTHGQRHQVPYAPPDFESSLETGVAESATTWLVPESSPLAVLAQDALMNKLRVHCFGRLAEPAGGWHFHFALPIILESMTLFAT